jgi:hypothetical protein
VLTPNQQPIGRPIEGEKNYLQDNFKVKLRQLQSASL